MKDKIKSAVTDKAKSLAKGMFNFPQIDSDIEVWFIFDGKEYEVSKFDICFGQSVDHKGQPQEEVRGGFMTVELTQAVPEKIYKWAMTSSLEGGSVEFRSKTSSAPLKIKFANAYCVNFARTVDNYAGLLTRLVISPEEVTINDIDMDNNWVGLN